VIANNKVMALKRQHISSSVNSYSIIRNATRTFPQSVESERARNLQLIGYGRRHSRFLGLTKAINHSPLFGLSDWLVLGGATRGPAERVAFFREVVSRALRNGANIEAGDLIIVNKAIESFLPLVDQRLFGRGWWEFYEQSGTEHAHCVGASCKGNLVRMKDCLEDHDCCNSDNDRGCNYS
jgi:hypothetical protein